MQRYFNFELARFGDARLAFEVNASPALLDMMVPPFLVQPLVENAIKHAMPSEGKLTITVKADADGDDVVIVVSDDGVGMTEETCANITQVESSTGLGIAVKNVHDRMIGFFGPDAQMVYTSVLGGGHPGNPALPGCAKAPTSAAASRRRGRPRRPRGRRKARRRRRATTPRWPSWPSLWPRCRNKGRSQQVNRLFSYRQ